MALRWMHNRHITLDSIRLRIPDYRELGSPTIQMKQSPEQSGMQLSVRSFLSHPALDLSVVPAHELA